MRNLILFGWILVNQGSFGSAVIAWYETEADCAKAGEYLNTVRCVPDRFAVEELREKQNLK